VRLVGLLKSFDLLCELPVHGFDLLRQESDLRVFGRHSVVQLLSQGLDVFVQLRLHFFGFLLKEENLVLVINLGLCQTLASLITHIVESLLKTHFLGVVEFLEVGKLPLGCFIDLIDGVLELTLLIFELLFKLVDLFFEALLGLTHNLLVLGVLLLAEGQVLISFFLCSLQ